VHPQRRRSQMALGFFQQLAGDAGVAWSGGSGPGLEINPAAIAAMTERASTSTNPPSRGPTRRSAPPTWSSPWAAATPARSSPGSATRTGRSTTRPGRTLRCLNGMHAPHPDGVPVSLAEALANRPGRSATSTVANDRPGGGHTYSSAANCCQTLTASDQVRGGGPVTEAVKRVPSAQESMA
jgi:hypothetical protein